MTNAKRYMKLKFYVENNGSEWAIFLCIFFIIMLIDDKEAILLGLVSLIVPIWIFFREKDSYEIKLIPISDKEMKELNRRYILLKFIQWFAFGLISFVLQRFLKSWAYSIGFFMIFSFVYLTLVMTKFLKREF